MIKVYVSTDLNIILLHIKQEINFSKITILDSFDLEKINNQIFQKSLFSPNGYFLINVSKIDLKNEQIKKTILLLSELLDVIYLYDINKKNNCEAFQKICSKNNFLVKKIYKKNNDEIEQIITSIAKNNNIILEDNIINYIIQNVPLDYDIINNEIKKLSLSESNIKAIFPYSNPDIFKVIEFCLKKQYTQMIQTIDNIIKKDNNVIQLVHLLSQQLFNFKLYFLAIKNNWDFATTSSYFKITPFQQKKYKEILYNTNIYEINNLLLNLYELDINTKKQKIDPYVKLICILLKKE